MARKKDPTTTKPKASRRKTKKTISKPDISILAQYSPTDEANSHPDWIKTQFPTYILPHTAHETSSVREFSHNGHSVKIITTYRVEVDGQLIRTNLNVDEDGQVHTHATPFVTYASAVTLMKAVISAYPNAFSNAGSDNGHDEHDHERDGGHS